MGEVDGLIYRLGVISITEVIHITDVILHYPNLYITYGISQAVHRRMASSTIQSLEMIVPKLPLFLLKEGDSKGYHVLEWEASLNRCITITQYVYMSIYKCAQLICIFTYVQDGFTHMPTRSLPYPWFLTHTHTQVCIHSPPHNHGGRNGRLAGHPIYTKRGWGICRLSVQGQECP